jgi:hypothetical protein
MTNLAESSKEGHASKRAVLPVMMSCSDSGSCSSITMVMVVLVVVVVVVAVAVAAATTAVLRKAIPTVRM